MLEIFWTILYPDSRSLLMLDRLKYTMLTQKYIYNDALGTPKILRYTGYFVIKIAHRTPRKIEQTKHIQQKRSFI